MEGVPAARGYKGGFTAKDMMEHLAAAIASQEILGPNLPMAEKALELYTQVLYSSACRLLKRVLPRT